jgi:hypothetical protein
MSRDSSPGARDAESVRTGCGAGGRSGPCLSRPPHRPFRSLRHVRSDDGGIYCVQQSGDTLCWAA